MTQLPTFFQTLEKRAEINGHSFTHQLVLLHIFHPDQEIYLSPECVEDHGEEDKLAEEGNHEGGRGDDLSQEEEEHGEREQDIDRETHLRKEEK